MKNTMVILGSALLLSISVVASASVAHLGGSIDPNSVIIPAGTSTGDAFNSGFTTDQALAIKYTCAPAAGACIPQGASVKITVNGESISLDSRNPSKSFILSPSLAGSYPGIASASNILASTQVICTPSFVIH